MNTRQIAICVLLTAFAALTAANAWAQACCDPASPFREGEGWADNPASCSTIARWAEQAPQTTARITMVIEGRLSDVQWDGALAYLVMCEAPGVMVMCVTYETNGMEPGDDVLFAGGYAQVGPAQVILDPCLATPQ